MAFDKKTRNELGKMVAECRRLLTANVRAQLQSVYLIQPDGKASDVGKLKLDDRGREIAIALRQWLEHLVAAESGTEKERRANAFMRMENETAFTYLNRLAALRMCEERGLVIECVRKGLTSSGFQLYERLADKSLGDRGDTYRVFLECLFDELAIDLGVLFDRRAVHSMIFPEAKCIEKVLEQLNKEDFKELWANDETIGWVYQFFNSDEERKKMRKKSAAPRNSRELAVRNQFFTPRYVVEFLTDNTLG
ncbi:MAG: SAM-dependent methyltransferase, partial [Planctomycetota bacterium]